MKPARTPEAREQQLISLAMDNAERQLTEGTASSQVITHFLKLGTIQAQYELEKIRKENELLAAKTAQIERSENIESLVYDAIQAFKGYSGAPEEEIYEELPGAM